TWRMKGGWYRLVLALLTAWAAGAFWTIGHAAGPTGAIYLWCDSRRHVRLASCVPLLATVASIGLALALGGRYINAKISFHGRTEREAVNFAAGASHTMQAIPENLVLENLGLECEMTEIQGALLTGFLFVLWILSWSKWGLPGPLEWSGMFLV